MESLEYRLLGPLEVTKGDLPLSLGRKQQRAVLALLLVHLNSSVSTDQLVEALWPDKQPAKPQTAIQGYVSGLRKSLGRDTIQTAGGGYALQLEPIQLDSHLFEQLLREGQKDLARHPRAAGEKFERALRLWRGPALAEFTYEHWAENEIGRLQELRLVCLEELAQAKLELGEHADLVGELETLIREQPLRERPRAHLMLALYRCGRQVEALAVYQQARAQLRDDLGLDPGVELQALHKQILTQDETLTTVPPVASPIHNLTAPANRLIGRQRELKEIEELLRSEDVRLLTLTGPGGTGKTRLAHEAARTLIGDFDDGVFYVPLATVRDPDLVRPTIAQTLGLQSSSSAGLDETLATYLSERELLLVLDNAEQLVAAAPQLANLIAGAPQLRVLVTSRTPLRVSGEYLYPVPSLGLPEEGQSQEIEELARSEAISLFVERAQAVDRGFSITRKNARAIAEICVSLDGLPLAIELAAARVSVLTPHAILQRLDQRFKLLTGGPKDVDERHRTLRATLDWSYNLLVDDEKALFARIAVFVDGCRLDAVEAICDPERELAFDVLDGLGSLVSNSLLRQREDPDGEPRFWMLETIREYARERLESSPELSQCRLWHARFFADLAKQAADGLSGADEAGWGTLIEHDLGNLRAAVSFARETGDADAELLFATSLGPYWRSRGNKLEGLEWLESALANATQDPRRRARALCNAAGLAALVGRTEDSYIFAEQAVSVFEHLGDHGGMAEASNEMAQAAYLGGDLRLAAELLERSGREARAAGQHRVLAHSLGNLGYVALHLGELDRAERLSEEALEIFKALGALDPVPFHLGNLALIALRREDLTTAEERAKDALRAAGATSNRMVSGHILVVLGSVTRLRGDADGAARILGAAEALVDECGAKILGIEREVFEAASNDLCDELGPGTYERERSAGYRAPHLVLEDHVFGHPEA
jgi:predicted ATPase/DNA-binding SARP family transcriptional activator